MEGFSKISQMFDLDVIGAGHMLEQMDLFCQIEKYIQASC